MNEQAIQEQYQHIVSLLEQKRLTGGLFMEL